MTRRQGIHYLRANARESSPSRLLFIDTESWWASKEKRELHTLRLWSARLVRRHDHEPKSPREENFWGHTADELAELAEQVTESSKTPWLYAHNLSYDLGLTRLPLKMIERGFELGANALASDAPWAQLKKDKQHLRLADSFSWLPAPLEKLAELLELRKPKLPDLEDDEALWLKRCDADVHILATAVCRVLDEWDRLGLGYWSLTGPGTGWNSLRHMVGQHLGRKANVLAHRSATATTPMRHAYVVIDPDPVARTFEREALYSGRRDLWRVGHLPRGPYVELDLKTAHLAICAGYGLPTRRQGSFTHLELDDWRLDNRFESLLAQVVVKVERPRYPLRVRGAILHPVGTFRTTLAGPEIKDARARGELLEIGPGYAYGLAPFMRLWSMWAMAILEDEPAAADPLLKLMVKNWSRTVPGRFGMQHSREVSTGPSHVGDWAIEPCAVGSPPARGFIFHFAGEWSEQVRDAEADDAFPAVLAHIQSWTRLLLNRALDAVPESLLVSCNTEGFWVHQDALAQLSALARLERPDLNGEFSAAQLAGQMLSKQTAPLEMRVKQTVRSLRLLSPQHLELDGVPRFAGVPKSATPTTKDAFEFMTWPALRFQIENGDPRGYVRERRRVNLVNLPVNRWVYADGCAEPVRMSYHAEEGVNLIHEPQACCSLHDAALSPLQHPALKRLL